MEEKKANYKYSWVASLVGAIFMIGYFILFMVTIIDTNSQEYFYGDGVTIDYNVFDSGISSYTFVLCFKK